MRQPGSHRGRKTSSHSFRCTDDVWERAKARAEREGVPMNYVMEQFIIGYANKALNLPTVTYTYGSK